MTRFNPSMVVNRLVVRRGTGIVFDEKFHKGVNILSGDNSSGKSTVLNLLFYALGGEVGSWSETALLCERALVEVSLSGRVATLARDITRGGKQAMEIFGGSYDLSLNASATDWLRYPYIRSSKESFSQAIFRLLGMPEASNDVSGNITIHQILRLLYADQLSPVESIFRFEQFDSPLIRESIGRLLCGAFENQLYANEIEIRRLEKDLGIQIAELRSLFSVLGKVEHSLTTNWVEAQKRILESERAETQSKIENAEKYLYDTEKKEKLTLKFQNNAYENVVKLQEKIEEIRRETDALTFSIADSDSFIISLEQKLSALNDSAAIAAEFGGVDFTHCPACLAAITDRQATFACKLCQSPFDGERTKDRVVAIINDISIQLKQSRHLQEKRHSDLKSLQEKFVNTKHEWRKAANKLSELQRSPSSELKDELRKLVRHAGYIDRQIDDLAEKARIAELIERASEKKAALTEQIDRLRTQNSAFRAAEEAQLARAATSVADEVRSLLHKDLPRQDSFIEAKGVAIDFEKNTISVDGHSYFSASSRVVLKNSFFLGFIVAALKERFFRHPRFCIIDTVEDKGIEPVRSHHFQNMMAEVSNTFSDIEHQIIFATANISPDLNNENYIIGRHFTREHKSLNII